MTVLAECLASRFYDGNARNMSNSLPMLPEYLIEGEVPVFVISLDDQEDRRRDLVEAGLPSEWVKRFFPATDLRMCDMGVAARHANVGEIERRFAELGFRRAIRPAEIGCAMSHRNICQQLVESRHSMALVLEDDVIPRSDWLPRTRAVAAALLRHANAGARFICHLGVPNSWGEPSLRRGVAWAEALPVNPPDIFLHTDPRPSLWRSHAYLISAAAALRGTREEKAISTLADDWDERKRRGWIDEVFYTQPQVFGQDDHRPSTMLPVGNPDDHVPRMMHVSFASRLARALQTGEVAGHMAASVMFRARMTTARLLSRFPYRMS